MIIAIKAMQSHAGIHDSVTGCTHLICADKTALCTTIITKLYKPGNYTNVHTQHLQHDYYCLKLHTKNTSTNTTVTSAPAPGHYILHQQLLSDHLVVAVQEVNGSYHHVCSYFNIYFIA